MKPSLVFTLLLWFPNLSAQQFLNLDFEHTLLQDRPVAWRGSRLLQQQTLVPTPGGSGQCLYLKAPFTARESGFVFQEIAHGLPRATRYLVTAKIRTKGVVGAGARVYAYGKANGEVIGRTQSTSLLGDTDWREVSFSMMLIPAMDTLRLGCFLGGEGEAWFDDLTFTPMEQEMKVTSPDA
ncbi:MAG: hypothetical protein AAF597_11655, partial [Bacteroidota bacterium]